MCKIKKIGLTTKLIIAVLSSSVTIYLLIFGLGYSLTNRIIMNNIDKIGENIIDSFVRKVDRIEEAVDRITLSTEFFLERIDKNNARTIFDLFEVSLRNNPEIFGISISFEPYTFSPKEKFFSPYCLRKDLETKCKMLGSEKYDYFKMDWYNEAKTTGRAIWVDPYLDEDSGNIYILSHSEPFYRFTPKGKIFEGVVSADISLKWLQETISSSAVGYDGYAFLISRDGKFITFPNEEFVIKRSIWDIANERNDKDLKKIATDMTARVSGISPFNDFITGKRSWIFYKPVQLSNWSIGVVFEEDKLLSDIYFIAGRMILLGILGLAILTTIIFILSRRITSPLIRLSSAASQIAHGNMDAKIPIVSRRDEVGTLASSFVSMQKDLKKYVKELTESVATQERVQNELKIAHNIQQSIVPKRFDLPGSAQNIKIFGTLLPAREVGGDLYDCFKIDETHTCFVVGDVSDKGVHAALIMAIVSTLLRGLSKDLCHPDEILKIVNKEIIERNPSSMFVTLFCGILNNETGKFKYANAGHVPPVLLCKGSAPILLTDGTGVPLGIKADAEFSWHNIKLKDDDKFFIYTDGVTEAVNSSGDFYGEEKLVIELKERKDQDPETLVNGILGSVKAYAGECPLSDDIALLCFSMGSSTKKNTMKLKIINRPDEIGRIATAITDFATSHGLGNELINEVNLAIEEVVINIIHFGFENKNERSINISANIIKDRFVVDITDDGRPFNPLEASPPDVNLSVEKRPIGGLGIYLVKHFVDDVVYERKKELNHLTLIKMILPKVNMINKQG